MASAGKERNNPPPWSLRDLPRALGLLRRLAPRNDRRGVPLLAMTRARGFVPANYTLLNAVSSGSQMEADQLQLGHLLDSISRSLLAEAALLEPAVRHQVGAPLGTPVDHQVARLDLAHKPHRPLQILGEDGGRKAVDRVVGKPDRLVERLEPRDRHGRTEQLVAGDPHLGPDVGDDRGGIDGPLALPARGHPRAARHRLPPPLLDPDSPLP